MKEPVRVGGLRLIPAGAGKTLETFRQPSTHSAHPRRCGENPPTITAGNQVIGSSPQVRGKRTGVGCCYRFPRLIPAGAGKTSTGGRPIPSIPAHPRRCGENLTKLHELTGNIGSSPQVRGKLCIVSETVCSIRLIPAGAGKTCTKLESMSASTAHPRRCGENGLLFCVPAVYDGSSPQVRGKRYGDAEPIGCDRLIPAGAGKTRTLTSG